MEVAPILFDQKVYRVQVSDKGGKDIFNGLADNVKLTSGTCLNLRSFIPRPGRSLLKRFTAEDAKLPLEEIISPTSTLSCIITTRKCNIWMVCASEHSTLTIHKPLMYRWHWDEVTRTTIFKDFTPHRSVYLAIWRTGKTFPASAGRRCSDCHQRAVDHAAQYPPIYPTWTNRIFSYAIPMFVFRTHVIVRLRATRSHRIIT